MRKIAQIISYSEIKGFLKAFEGKKTVLIGGCFDLIHYGHLQFLIQAKNQGNYLIILLESDKFIKKNKKRESIHTQDERAEILANFQMVDMVIKIPYFSSDEDYLNIVKIINPKVIAVTEGDLQLKNKKNQARLVGAKIVIVTPLLKKFSTRKIIISHLTGVQG